MEEDVFVLDAAAVADTVQGALVAADSIVPAAFVLAVDIVPAGIGLAGIDLVVVAVAHIAQDVACFRILVADTVQVASDLLLTSHFE